MFKRIRHLTMRLNYPLSVKSRRSKLDLFWRLMQPKPGEIVLNLGAAPPHLGRVLIGSQQQNMIEQPEQDPRWQALQVIAISINADDIREYNSLYPGNSGLVSDGCNLPFAEKSVDIVFSNAVIEHLQPDRQLLMAREIMRVGRSWFVATPNFWYPIELHHKLPFIHFFPQKWQELIAERFGTWPQGEPIHLLTARQLKALFPNSRILKLRITFWPESLIAFHREPS